MPTNKHLSIVRDEIIVKSATYSDWTPISATDAMKFSATNSMVDYHHIANLAVVLMRNEKTDVPDVEHILKAVGSLRDEYLWVSDDELLVQSITNAMADADSMDTFTKIGDCDEIVHAYRDKMIRELSAIFSICVHKIADVEYAEYSRLHDRVTD